MTGLLTSMAQISMKGLVTSAEGKVRKGEKDTSATGGASQQKFADEYSKMK
jgi:hypothetical protein